MSLTRSEVRAVKKAIEIQVYNLLAECIYFTPHTCSQLTILHSYLLAARYGAAMGFNYHLPLNLQLRRLGHDVVSTEDLTNTRILMLLLFLEMNKEER